MKSIFPMVALLGFVSCPSTKVYRFCSQDANEGVEISRADQETGAKVLPTGAPCTTNEECFGGFCLTTDFAKMIDEHAEVPNGACSMLGCSTDEECGPSAFCLPPSGSIPMSLCLPLCKSGNDCRFSEGYICFGAKELGEKMACLPAGIITLLLCGNGTCEVHEMFDRTVCPIDCCPNGECDPYEAMHKDICPEDCQ
jgi:hypothetical protein